MKQIKSILLILCLLLSMTGCQLADPEAGSSPARDRLIGALATTEPLDLFDFEGYLEDNLNSISGGDITLDERDVSQYQGRIYGTPVDETLTAEDGTETTLRKFVFEDVDGFAIMSYYTIDPETGEGYNSSIHDDAVSDVHYGVHESDDGSSHTLRGTIYLSPAHGELVMHLNPIYQTPEGDVYVISDSSGVMIGDGNKCEGEVWTVKLDETVTTTVNGESENFTCTVEMCYSVLFTPERITVLQMAEDGVLVQREEYEPGAMPETFVPEADTDYLIVETHKRDGDGKPLVTREIFDKEDEVFGVYEDRGDGICIKSAISLLWKE